MVQPLPHPPPSQKNPTQNKTKTTQNLFVKLRIPVYRGAVVTYTE